MSSRSLVASYPGKMQISKDIASLAFGRLKKNIWSQKDIQYETQNSSIQSSTNIRDALPIMRISRIQRYRNVDIRQTLGVQKTIVDAIKERRLRYFGHI